MVKPSPSARSDASPSHRCPSSWSRPSFLFLGGLQHLAGLGVDKMNSRASGTRHGFVNLAIRSMIDSNPTLHLQTSSWAAVDEGNNHLLPIWQQRRSMALLILANILFAWANFTQSDAKAGRSELLFRRTLDNGAAAADKRI